MFYNFESLMSLITFLQHGVPGVYRGFTVSLLGAVLFRAMYMGNEIMYSATHLKCEKGGYDTVKSNLIDSGIVVKYMAAQVIIY